MLRSGISFLSFPAMEQKYSLKVSAMSLLSVIVESSSFNFCILFFGLVFQFAIFGKFQYGFVYFS